MGEHPPFAPAVQRKKAEKWKQWKYGKNRVWIRADKRERAERHVRERLVYLEGRSRTSPSSSTLMSIVNLGRGSAAYTC